MSAEIEKPSCGECALFDPNSVDKKPVGTTIGVDGQEIPLGYCRGLFGPMRWGATLTQETSCKQSPEIFQPKEPSSEPSVA
jgi:hypothetical protein